MDKHLHIITLDVPWPADYGGVVDMFYKIVHLHEQAVKIHLHCYTNGREPQDELNKYCETVNYYTRSKKAALQLMGLPYIVSSRSHQALLERLRQDNYPVLMEGIHCTYLLHKGDLQNRKVFVRPHNVEFDYYRKLAEHESKIWKKLYYNIEAMLLKRYEKNIAGKATFWPLNVNDTLVFKGMAGNSAVDFLPLFVPWEATAPQSGKGCFCLYHGNLSVNENEKAAAWLLTQVFNELSIPLVIAGKNPSPHLKQLAHVHKNTCLVANPSQQEMQDLIKKAQINILPSFNNTGVKVKILNALFNGRYCLTNAAAIEGARLDKLCELAETPQEFREAIAALYEQPFSKEEAEVRASTLLATYNNTKNAAQLIQWIF
ncbi:MAG: glycosyltransferase [Flavobacterium sp.]|nr:MAG: glycosyltransferase [Flavobacterium sp.]